MATFADNSVANFFFSLAMATKMVAAWSADLLYFNKQDKTQLSAK